MVLWDEIREISLHNNFHWVIGGDFNVIRYAEECYGWDHNTQDRENFNGIISELGLIKIPLID